MNNIDSYTNRSHHYTRDNDVITLLQTQENTFMRAELAIKIYKFSGEFETYNRTVEFMFFNGKIEFNPGTLIHNLMDYNLDYDNIRFTDFRTSGIYNMYQFAEVNMIVNIIDYNSRENVESITLENLKFLKGETPKFKNQPILQANTFLNNRVGLVNKATVNSILSINFLMIESAQLEIKLNGIAIDLPISNTSGEANIFGLLLNLNDIEELQENDVLTIHYTNQQLTYIIEEEGLQSVNVFFVDQYGLFQSFEFTGEISVNENFERTTTNYYKNNTENFKNLLTEKKHVMKLNTGYIPKENSNIIEMINLSEKAYILINENLYEARQTSTKMTNYDSATNLISHEVEFELINTTYDNIYL